MAYNIVYIDMEDNLDNLLATLRDYERAKLQNEFALATCCTGTNIHDLRFIVQIMQSRKYSMDTWKIKHSI